MEADYSGTKRPQAGRRVFLTVLTSPRRVVGLDVTTEGDDRQSLSTVGESDALNWSSSVGFAPSAPPFREQRTGLGGLRVVLPLVKADWLREGLLAQDSGTVHLLSFSRLQRRERGWCCFVVVLFGVEDWSLYTCRSLSQNW